VQFVRAYPRESFARAASSSHALMSLEFSVDPAFPIRIQAMRLEEGKYKRKVLGLKGHRPDAGLKRINRRRVVPTFRPPSGVVVIQLVEVDQLRPASIEALLLCPRSSDGRLALGDIARARAQGRVMQIWTNLPAEHGPVIRGASYRVLLHWPCWPHPDAATFVGISQIRTSDERAASEPCRAARSDRRP